MRIEKQFLHHLQYLHVGQVEQEADKGHACMHGWHCLQVMLQPDLRRPSRLGGRKGAVRMTCYLLHHLQYLHVGQ